MRAAVFVLCTSALVGGALANQPTPLDRQFAGLRIAIRAGDNEKAKKLLTSGARNWGKDFIDKQGALSDTLLQTCAEAGNYELAKDLIMAHDADVDYKDRKGGTAYSFCEKRRDNDERNGDPPGCEPELWLQLVEDCLAAKEAGETDLALGSRYDSASGMGKGARTADSGDDGDTPEKQRERLAAYEAERKAKESMTADQKENEKQRKKKEMQERIAEKRRKKAEEAAEKEL